MSETQFSIPPSLNKEMAPEQLAEQLARSVIQTFDASKNPFGASNLIYMLANVADEIPAWGTNPFARDMALRRFFGTESFTTSAISTIVARNVAFPYQVVTEDGASGNDLPDLTTPDERKAEADAQLKTYMLNVLQSADFGRGWNHMVSRLSFDYLTQDRGAFMEIIKAEHRYNAKVIGLNALDANRCWHTGDPEYPVLYIDRNGKWNKMEWWRVAQISELPMPQENGYGLQFCALSRILKAAQIFRNIAIYQEEKTGGRYTKAIHIIAGVTTKELEDAINARSGQADALGAMRYMQPAVLATLDPNADPKLVTLELASLPESWKLEEMFKWFTTIVALGLLSDFGDFAPLPGNNMGTATQSTEMAERSKNKGSALWRSNIEFVMNFKGVMPEGTRFEYNGADIDEEKAEAELTKARADARGVMLKNGEIDRQAARKMALQQGDIPQDIYDDVEERGIADAESPLGADEFGQLMTDQTMTDAQLLQELAAADDEEAQQEVIRRVKARTEIPKRAGPGVARLELEDEYSERIAGGLKAARDRVAAKLRAIQ